MLCSAPNQNTISFTTPNISPLSTPMLTVEDIRRTTAYAVWPLVMGANQYIMVMLRPEGIASGSFAGVVNVTHSLQSLDCS